MLIAMLAAIVALAVAGVSALGAHAASSEEPDTLQIMNENSSVWNGSVLNGFGTTVDATHDEDHEMAIFRTSDGRYGYCAATVRQLGTTPGQYFTYKRADDMPMSPALYYVMTHGYPFTTTIGGHTFSAADARAVTQVAVYRVQRGVGFRWDSTHAAAVNALVAAANTYAANGGKSYAHLYYYDNSHQPIAIAQTVTPPNGKVNVKKSSSNASISDGSSQYSLANCVYSVYASESDANNGANALATLTTGTDGTSNTVEVNMDKLADKKTAYVKETTAPRGFKLDKSVHAVTLVSDQTSTLTTTDEPVGFPPEADSKVDHESDGPAQGAALLEDAQYTVTLNDGTKDIRSWVFKTDANGYIKFDDAHKVSGDAIYKDGDGNAIMPLGTYTIKETSAPTGYLLDSQWHTITV